MNMKLWGLVLCDSLLTMKRGGRKKQAKLSLRLIPSGIHTVTYNVMYIEAICARNKWLGRQA